MAPGRLIDRPVKARQEEDYHDKDDMGFTRQAKYSLDAVSQPSDSSGENESADGDFESDAQGHSSPDSGQNEEAHLKDISFGALVQAQAALGSTSRKRNLQESDVALKETEDTFSNKAQRREERERTATKEHPSRSSKHAPATQSSRRAVTRRREVFSPPAALKSRDPRFDPMIQASNRDPNAPEIANKNYSFLTAYQASEVLDLKSQIKKAKDPEVVAELKRQVMSLESKLRRAEAKQRERDILRRHRQEEREAIKSGDKAKPYYLKKSDVKKEAMVEKFNSMSKKARDKAVERKRKRTKGKEARHMPRTRRVA